MHPRQGATRLARASVFAATCLVLSGGTHQLGGGHPPSLGALLLAAGPVWLVAAALTSRRCRAATLVVALGLVQAALHVFFHLTALPAATPGLVGSGPQGLQGLHRGHHGIAPVPDGLHAVAHGLPAGAHTTSSLGSLDIASLGITPTMLAAHVGATLLCALLMACAEGWLWQLVQRSPAWRLAVVAPLPAPRRPLWRVRHRHVPVGLGRRVIPGRVLRGPPVAFAL